MLNAKNTTEFINLLEKEYPEKALAILGLDFPGHVLGNYLKENLLNEHTFNPTKFKKHLDDLSMPDFSMPTINQLDPTKTYNMGDLVFETNTNTLKMFDGNNWINVITA